MRRNGLEKYLYYGLGILAVLFVVVGLTAALNGTGIDSMPLRAKREETVKGKKDREKQEEAKQEEAKQ